MWVGCVPLRAMSSWCIQGHPSAALPARPFSFSPPTPSLSLFPSFLTCSPLSLCCAVEDEDSEEVDEAGIRRSMVGRLTSKRILSAHTLLAFAAASACVV